MLARHFKSAVELGIAISELDAFRQLLGMLERGELVHADPRCPAVPNGFNMSSAEVLSNCGLTACLYGLVKRLSGRWMTEFSANSNLEELFCPWSIVGERTLSKITPQEAALALRNFLTLGEACWPELIGLF